MYKHFREKFKYVNNIKVVYMNYENKILSYLKERGYIISQWTNDIDLTSGEIVESKNKPGYPQYIVLCDIENYFLAICKKDKNITETEKKKIHILTKKYMIDVIIFVYDEKTNTIKSYHMPKQLNQIIQENFFKI